MCSSDLKQIFKNREKKKKGGPGRPAGPASDRDQAGSLGWPAGLLLPLAGPRPGLGRLALLGPRPRCFAGRPKAGGRPAAQLRCIDPIDRSSVSSTVVFLRCCVVRCCWAAPAGPSPGCLAAVFLPPTAPFWSPLFKGLLPHFFLRSSSLLSLLHCQPF